MASRIKGLTVEIGGDTVKLQAALKDVDKSISDTSRSLKDINRLLKLNPESTELLSQKQKNLATQIDNTKQRLTQLNEAYEAASKEKGYDPKNLDALQREILDTEGKLKNLEGQADQTSKALNSMGKDSGGGLQSIAQAAGDKLGSISEKADKAASAMAPVTAGVVGIGTAAMGAWSELDEAYDGIAAGTGATGEALENLQGDFKEVYGSFPADSAEVSTAIADINTRFGLTGKALQDASKKFLQFSEVNGVDVGPAIASVAKAMNDAGIPADQLGQVLDQITAVSQSSGASVDQLADSLSKNGVTMRALGYDTGETLAMLGTFEAKGVDAGVVLGGMKKAVSNFAAEGKDAKTEIKNLFDNIQNGSATAADAQEAFGVKAGAAIYNYAKEGKLSFGDLMEVVKNSGGQLEQTFEDMEDPTDKLTTFMNNLKLAGADLGDALQGVLEPVIENLVQSAQSLSKWFGSLSDGQKDFIVKAGLAAAAASPLLKVTSGLTGGMADLLKGTRGAAKGIETAFGTISGTVGSALSHVNGGVGSLVGSFSQIRTGFSGLGAVFSGIAGPVTIAVAAIAGLAAVFATLWTNNKDFHDRMVGLWNGLKDTISGAVAKVQPSLDKIKGAFSALVSVVQPIWNRFCSLFAPVFEFAFANITTVLESVLNGLVGILNAFIALFSGNWQGFWNGIGQVLSAIWDLMKGTVMNGVQLIEDIINTFLGWFGGHWDFSKMGQDFQNAWNGMVQWLSNACTTMQTNVSNFCSSVSSSWNAFCTSVSQFFQNVWNGISSFFGTITNSIAQSFNGFSSTFTSNWNSLWNNVNSFFQNIWNNLQSFVTNLWNGIQSTASNVWNAIKDAISNPIQQAADTVNNVFTNIQNWITDKINAARDAVGNAIDAIKGFFNFEIQWPHIPMPQFEISPSGWQIGDLLKGSIPTLSIAWNAEGGILNGAQIFGAQGNTLLGGGEAGPEAVLPLDTLWTKMGQMMESTSPDLSPLEQMVSVLVANSAKQIVMDNGALVGQLAPSMNRALGSQARVEAKR